MKIQNRTHFDTVKMRSLFLEVLKRNGYNPKRPFTVDVGYSKGLYSGKAWLKGFRMEIRVPKTRIRGDRFTITRELIEELESDRLARLFEHETYHLYSGLRHEDMERYLPPIENYEWANEYRIKRIEKEPKPDIDLRLKRYGHVLEKVEEYRKKIKRYENLLKKWQKKQRYYDRVFAQAANRERKKD